MQLPVTVVIRRSHLLARLLYRGDVAALTLRADGLLGIEHDDGSIEQAVVHPDTTVLPWLVVLRCRTDGRIRTLTLPRAAMDVDAHRQLRLWLRWKADAKG